MECDYAPRGAYVCDYQAIARCQACGYAYCNRHVRRCAVCFTDLCVTCIRGHVCSFGF